MPDVNDHDDRLVIIEDLVNRLNDEPVRDIHGQTDGGDMVEGLQIQRREFQYKVLSSPAWEHIMVRYDENVDGLWHVRTKLPPSEREGPVNVNEDEIHAARQELEAELQDYPPVDKREMLLNLKQILSREGCGVSFDTITEPYNIHGFSVDKKVFPNEDEFRISDFEKAVQNVINFGWTGKDLIMEYYGLAPGSSSGSPGYQS